MGGQLWLLLRLPPGFLAASSFSSRPQFLPHFLLFSSHCYPGDHGRLHITRFFPVFQVMIASSGCALLPARRQPRLQF